MLRIGLQSSLLTWDPLRDLPANRPSDSRTCVDAERLSLVLLDPAISPIAVPADLLSRTSLWWHLCGCVGVRVCRGVWKACNGG